MTRTRSPRLGFLGTGKIAGAMVEGFSGGPQPPPSSSPPAAKPAPWPWPGAGPT